MCNVAYLARFLFAFMYILGCSSQDVSIDTSIALPIGYQHGPDSVIGSSAQLHHALVHLPFISMGLVEMNFLEDCAHSVRSVDASTRISTSIQLYGFQSSCEEPV